MPAEDEAQERRGSGRAAVDGDADLLRYSTNHWGQIRTNNPMERVIRQRTRVVGTFPDGHSTLMLVAARRTHIGSTRWGRQRCMLMDALLNPANQEAAASERTFCPAFGRLDRAAAPPRHASSRWNEITDERRTRHSDRQESAKIRCTANSAGRTRDGDVREYVLRALSQFADLRRPVLN